LLSCLQQLQLGQDRASEPVEGEGGLLVIEVRWNPQIVDAVLAKLSQAEPTTPPRSSPRSAAWHPSLTSMLGGIFRPNPLVAFMLLQELAGGSVEGQQGFAHFRGKN
jgi:hypothetical protein